MSAILYFSKILFSKIEENFLEVSRKHVFTAANSNIIKNRVEKKKLDQILSKGTVFLFKL